MWNASFISNTKGLLKIDKWWVYKIGSGVFTLILLKVLCLSEPLVTFNFSDLILFGMLVLLAVYGHFINDFSDFEIDKIAGKSNIFNTLPKRIAPLLIVILGVSAISISILVFSKHVLFFAGLQIFCSILYSIRPFRLKERGILALALTGFYERLNPYIIIVLCTMPNWLQLELKGFLFILFYLVWSYLWECRNFINGQLEDVENDQQSEVKSIVISMGKSQTVLIKKVLLFIEVLMLISWLSIMVVIEFNLVYFLLAVLVFQLIQVFGSRTRYRKVEIVLDNCYSNIFMAGLLIILSILGAIDPFIAAGIIFFFQYRVIADAIDFIYNRFRHVLIFFWKLWHGEFNKKNQKN